jgi:hypothetical protein
VAKVQAVIAGTAKDSSSAIRAGSIEPFYLHARGPQSVGGSNGGIATDAGDDDSRADAADAEYAADADDGAKRQSVVVDETSHLQPPTPVSSAAASSEPTPCDKLAVCDVFVVRHGERLDECYGCR